MTTNCSQFKSLSSVSLYGLNAINDVHCGSSGCVALYTAYIPTPARRAHPKGFQILTAPPAMAAPIAVVVPLTPAMVPSAMAIPPPARVAVLPPPSNAFSTASFPEA